MRFSCLLSVLTAALLGTSFAYGDELIRLYTFTAPPYQQLEGTSQGTQIISGITVETVTCATEKAGWETSISLVPQNRAIYALRNNHTDGYFASYSAPAMDRSLKRSAPVALEKWYFYSLSPDTDPARARIGAVSGSNEHLWLENQGYKVFLTVPSARQLLALLNRQRIDMALMDSRVMENLVSGSDEISADQLHRRFLRYAPLYLYVSPDFNHRHPEFLDGFNTYLGDCLEGQFDLDEQEKMVLAELASQLVGELRSRLDLRQAIRSGPRIENLSEVLKKDSMWQALAPEAFSNLAEEIAGLPTSQQLEEFESEYSGLITEIMLTNEFGTLVGMSRLTSDYWQGDEPKFRQLTDEEDPEAMYISPIRYDQSTGHFQVSVSVPVTPDSGGEPEGVLVLGIDIEQALERQPAPR